MMAKYMSIAAGSIVALLGLFGVMAWQSDLVTVIKGLLPAIMIFAGVIAAIAGLSELKDEAASKRQAPKQ